MSQQPQPTQCSPSPSLSPWQGQGQMRIITSGATKFQVLVRLKELSDVFKSFDYNGDSKISGAELHKVIRVTLGSSPSEQKINEFVGKADWDGDGCIDLREFVHLHSRDIDIYQTMDDLLAGFQIFDLDKSGRITAEELHRVMKRLGDPASLDDCIGFINVIDRDGDGVVSFEEFHVLMPPPSTSPTAAPKIIPEETPAPTAAPKIFLEETPAPTAAPFLEETAATTAATKIFVEETPDPTAAPMIFLEETPAPTAAPKIFLDETPAPTAATNIFLEETPSPIQKGTPSQSATRETPPQSHTKEISIFHRYFSCLFDRCFSCLKMHK